MSLDQKEINEAMKGTERTADLFSALIRDDMRTRLSAQISNTSNRIDNVDELSTDEMKNFFVNTIVSQVNKLRIDNILSRTLEDLFHDKSKYNKYKQTETFVLKIYENLRNIDWYIPDQIILENFDIIDVIEMANQVKDQTGLESWAVDLIVSPFFEDKLEIKIKGNEEFDQFKEMGGLIVRSLVKEIKDVLNIKCGRPSVFVREFPKCTYMGCSFNGTLKLRKSTRLVKSLRNNDFDYLTEDHVRQTSVMFVDCKFRNCINPFKIKNVLDTERLIDCIIEPYSI